MEWIFLGVDPGVSGAITAINDDGDIESTVRLNLPHREIYEHLAGTVYDRRAFAILEQVNAMPGQGVTSMFKFGASFGACQMLLACCGVPYRQMVPRKWQALLGVTPPKGLSQTQRKNHLKCHALKLYPDSKAILATSDAILLGELARRLSTPLRGNI